MKKKSLILIAGIIFTAISVKAQLKVFSDGHVSVGSVNYPSGEFGVTGFRSVYSYGGHTFTIKPANPTVELGSSDGNIVFWHSTGLWNTLQLGPSYYISDERTKKDITSVNSKTCLQLISELKPKKYQFKDSIVLNSGLRYGFLAQDVMGVIPEVVDTHEVHGVMTMDYIQIIPLLAGAIKEQSETIDSLQEQITAIQSTCCTQQINRSTNTVSNDSLQKELTQLKQELTYLRENCCRSSLAEPQVSSDYLSQNIPNPFEGTTTIPFVIITKYQNSYIKIYTLNGEELKSFRINNEDKQIVLNLQDLKSGMYLYSLICDGKLIDSKKMILSK